jgi:GMP synthase (glutamine-hydrolysing)
MLLIIKPGQKLPTLAHVPGDFDSWILQGMGPPAVATQVVRVHEGEPLPDAALVRAVVISGSGAMVTDGSGWIEATAAWLRGAAERGLPMLGICFGHQLLAHALGGCVDDNPNGIEVGTVQVDWMPEARGDWLFEGLSGQSLVQASHRQSVLALPPGARWLARSLLERHHAFAWGDHVWGVQFHPEFSPDIVRQYVDYYAERLIAEGRDPETLRQEVQASDLGPQLLQRFARLAGLSD